MQVQEAKQAAAPYTPGTSPEAADANSELKAEALRRALKAGLLGLGGGVGLAALLGAPRFLRRGPGDVPSYPLQTEVDLPYPQPAGSAGGAKSASVASVADTAIGNPLGFSAVGAAAGALDAEDGWAGARHGAVRGALQGLATVPGALAGESLGTRATAALLRRRPGLGAAANYRVPLTSRRLLPMLGGVGGGAASLALASPLVEKATEKLVGKKPREKKADWAKVLADRFLAPAPGAQAPTVGSPRWLRGDSQTSVNAIPWTLPAMAGAFGAGLYGGHELVRGHLKRRGKADIERELSEAQKEYEEAMLAQYDPAKLRSLSAPKEAAASPPALDACFDALEKCGFDVNGLLGQATGVYGVGAGMLGIGAGVGTYRWLRGRSGEKVLREALKRRATLRSLQNPPDVYVRPVPVEYVGGDDKAD